MTNSIFLYKLVTILKSSSSLKGFKPIKLNWTKLFQSVWFNAIWWEKWSISTIFYLNTDRTEPITSLLKGAKYVIKEYEWNFFFFFCILINNPNMTKKTCLDPELKLKFKKKTYMLILLSFYKFKSKQE